MLLTKAEAAEVWCPMNRGAAAPCVADKCAMWRWGPSVPNRKVFAIGPGHGVDNPENYTCEDRLTHKLYTETDEAMNARRAGYCGLAGAPL